MSTFGDSKVSFFFNSPRRFNAALKNLNGELLHKGPVFLDIGPIFYAYTTGTSASAEVSVAYAATGDLAGETKKTIFFFAD
jgi:hypothetical protein